MQLLQLAAYSRVGFADEPLDFSPCVSAGFAMTVEYHGSELGASPSHRSRRNLQVGDITIGVDLNKDTLHYPATSHGGHCVREVLTVTADLGEIVLELPFPFLNVCHVRQPWLFRQLKLDSPSVTKLGPKTIRKLPAVLPKAIFIRICVEVWIARIIHEVIRSIPPIRPPLQRICEVARQTQ
ncbi:hypothetical protein AWN90_20700 [Nocardia terpenica]|uniref:Uncharacterized protein n=1 Tax=Nocardia terpenica TaxID=455432 RepID=A0A164PM58_9NOCA|nr:hypothetical protein AWN90_20700 [Nocardia terpenica]